MLLWESALTKVTRELSRKGKSMSCRKKPVPSPGSPAQPRGPRATGVRQGGRETWNQENQGLRLPLLVLPELQTSGS